MHIEHRVDVLPYGKTTHEALFQDKWIDYDVGTKATTKLWLLFHEIASVRTKGLLIYGKPNSGKSMLVHKFRADIIEQYQEKDLESKLCPVLLIETPGHRANPKSLFIEILKSMNAPISSSHNADKLLEQIEILVRKHNIRMIVLDEIHNIMYAHNHERSAFLNSIRYLSNKLDLRIVMVGTDHAHHMIQIDPQLASRIAPFPLTPWRRDDKNYAAFVLQLIMGCGLKICDDNKRTSFMHLMHDRTEGLTGETKDLVVRAAMNSLNHNLDHIPAEVLSQTDWMMPSERHGVV
ncbi:TniB family NTP-binding protein [Aestuariispira insulae]|uniref:TniB protein n=1 Tax=Aestuariispira insulae TaxID=1461337 RepID=A0A3D9H0Q2_9PROT|nr:TniB family NTP-binding protein [Aestuariispira insulae]RED43087.1 TniB protein [Aestuariispira insulae]